MIREQKISSFKEFGMFFILLLIFFNGLQSIDRDTLLGWKGKIYILVHLVCLGLLIFQIINNFKNKGVLFKTIIKFWNLPINKSLKIAVIIVFMGNLVSIGIGKPSYPFYDVGMFRWSKEFSNPSKILYRTKYYYWKDSKAKVLDLRREGFVLLSEHFGWGYSHEFTFSANYHNKGQKENFDFILSKVKSLGIDTLWVGVQTVNYASGEVKFDPDICNAIEINNSKEIYYGPIYMPHYQINKCK
jgi:hypothetical protein